MGPRLKVKGLGLATLGFRAGAVERFDPKPEIYTLSPKRKNAKS